MSDITDESDEPGMSENDWAIVWHEIDTVRAERDAANARADQAIRFAAQVEEECARLTEGLRNIHDGTVEEWHVVSYVGALLDPPIIHDLPSDTETGS